LLIVLLSLFNVFTAHHFVLNGQIPLRLCRNRDRHAIELPFSCIVFESAKHLFWPQFFLVTILPCFTILLVRLQRVLDPLAFLWLHFVLFIFQSPSNFTFLTLLHFHHRLQAKVPLFIFWYPNDSHVSFLLSKPQTVISYYWVVLYFKTYVLIIPWVIKIFLFFLSRNTVNRSMRSIEIPRLQKRSNLR